MHYDLLRQKSLIVVRLEGEITAGAAGSRLIEEIRREALGRKVHLVVDLTNVSYVNTSGLRLLSQIQEDVVHRGGSFGLVNLPRSITLVLYNRGLLGQFRCYRNVEEAEQLATERTSSEAVNAAGPGAT